MKDHQFSPINPDQHVESIDMRMLLVKALRLWYVFLISILLSMFVASLFNKYTKPVYEVSSTVLIQDAKKGGLGDLSSIMGFSYGNSQQNLQNEIGMLNSEALVKKALQNIQWQVSYFSRVDFVHEELYKNSPVVVEIDTIHPQPVGLKFNVVILSDKRYSIETEGEMAKLYIFSRNDFVLENEEPVVVDRINFKGTFTFGEWITHENFRFRLVLNSRMDSRKYVDKAMYFFFNDLDSQVNQYRDYTVEPINREASILQIKAKGSNVKKIGDFLNSLVSSYITLGLERKNQIATKTVEFIDRELVGIRDSLTIAESQLVNFRKTNQIVKIDFEAQQVFGYLNELDKQMAEIRIKNKYYNYLRDYVLARSDVSDVVAPSSFGVEDPLLGQMLTELGHLYSERSTVLLTSTVKNPVIGQLDSQINTVKTNLLETLNSLINASAITTEEVNNKMASLTRKISTLPENQRKLLTFEREFNLNNNLFTFLLQRRAEAQITKASNLPDNQIVDVAKSTPQPPIFPKKGLNLLIGFLIGLAVPSVYIYAAEMWGHKVASRRDLERFSQFPSIGYVLHTHDEAKLVAYSAPKSVIAESFRTLRTNLLLLSKDCDKQVVLITSDLVGAGKSFIASNLAITYAQFGKRTLLLGFDLRKPKLFQEFGISNRTGISTFLNGKCEFNEAVFPTSIPDLFLAPAGPIPPNPLVLIYSEKTEEFFRMARAQFDYVIVDTPPVGLMTDAVLLLKHADYSLYVVRQGITNKNALTNITSDLIKQGVSNMYTVMNDVKYSEGGYTYGYGYSYSMGYGYGFDPDEDEYDDDIAEEEGVERS